MVMSVTPYRYSRLGGGGYSNKVLGTEPGSLIGYWPMNEKSGTNSDNAEGTAARDGTYTGVTLGQTGIGDGNTCPFFDGANDFNDIYTVSLSSAFNGSEGTLMTWFKVSGAGVWTDGESRYTAYIKSDADNVVFIRKDSVNNTLRYNYRSGGVSELVLSTQSATSWYQAVITWSQSGNAVKCYVNGAQTGSTQTIANAWGGVGLDNNETHIGAASTTPTNVTDGYLAHVAIWTTDLSPAQIADLYVV